MLLERKLQNTKHLRLSQLKSFKNGCNNIWKFAPDICRARSSDLFALVEKKSNLELGTSEMRALYADGKKTQEL